MRKMNKNLWFCCLMMCGLLSCDGNKEAVLTIGFLDAIEDATLQEAKQGYIEALDSRGWSESKKNLRIISRNAQGDVPTLVQSIQYFSTGKVDLIAANSTLSTISAVQYVQDIPICMMVGPEPWMAGLSKGPEDIPSNLFGVYETLDYIDTAFQIIRMWMPDARRVGVIYNQAETQSLNALARIRASAEKAGVQIIATPVVNSSETQLVVQSLLAQDIDAFFAMPDNVIFSSFEIIWKSCDEAGVPIFTSEAGLVGRGAVAAFGADFYQWGYQAGLSTADYLESNRNKLPRLEVVKARRKVYNAQEVDKYNFEPGSEFQEL